jgi:hypothetical protein
MRRLTMKFRRIGSGPGIRTLNLAVNRSLQPDQKSRSEFAECRRVSPFVVFIAGVAVRKRVRGEKQP